MSHRRPFGRRQVEIRVVAAERTLFDRLDAIGLDATLRFGLAVAITAAIAWLAR